MSAATIFKSNPPNPDAADPDLHSPMVGGNLNGQYMGNMLIIAENLTDGNGDGFVDRPDDQAGGGTISLFFDSPTASFGLDLVDVEQVEDGMLVFHDAGGISHTTSFASLVARDGAVFGNRTLNRVAPFQAADHGGDFVRVDVVRAYSRIRFRESTKIRIPSQSFARLSSIWAQLAMITQSPGFTRWAAAPFTQISREPASPSMT